MFKRAYELMADLRVIDLTGSKPNYAELGRKYGLDPRTVKKYHSGYEGKPKTRDKPSILDKHLDEINEKISIPRTTLKGVWECLVTLYSYDEIGTYSNFKAYCKKHNIKSNKLNVGKPRYETEPGDMAQCDWKERITLTSKNGEVFIINIFHIILKFSRYSYIELSMTMEQKDLFRCLINSFKFFGGIPSRLLFDNMPTAADTNVYPKRINARLVQFAKDFNFEVKLCKVRSPGTKGTNESRNKILDWIRPYDKEFETINDLIKIVEKINKDMNLEVCQGTGMAPILLYQNEKRILNQNVNKDLIDQYLSPAKVKVDQSQLIYYKGNKYSLDSSLIDQFVQPEEFDGNLYLYYKGKLVQIHKLVNSPEMATIYDKSHYTQMMAKNVKQDDLDKRVNDNLKIMDLIMEKRKVNITKQEAIGSLDSLYAYLIQISNNNGYIKSFLSSLNKEEEKIFYEEMKKMIPYIKDEEQFYLAFRHGVKKDNLKRIRMNYYILQDNMNYCPLSNEGLDLIYDEFKDEINSYYKDMTEDEHE